MKEEGTKRSECGRLSKFALGMALGLTWGVSIFLLGLLGGTFEWAEPMVNTLSVFYIGYEPGFVGSIIGGLIGFVDGFIGGVVIAWLYNLSLCCRHCLRSCKKGNQS